MFLKLLVKEKADLYSYVHANTRLFYYQLDDDDITILEHKEYLNDDNQVLKNQQNKSKLYSTLKCNSIDMDLIINLDYKSQDLINFMTIYNTCMNELSYTHKKKVREKVFNITIRPGINLSNAKISSTRNSFTSFDFGEQTTFRFGVEFEYILPFNNNKWSLILEPTYQHYKSEKTFDRSPSPVTEILITSKIDYSSIEMPFGVRHYSYLSSKSNLFLNASVILDLPTTSETEHLDNRFEGESNINFGLGFGYNYHKKFSIEARLQTQRELLDKETAFNLKYTTMSIIFGYTIF